MRQTKTLKQRWLSFLGAFAFFLYASWNVYWWCNGQLAPSVLLKVFGVPAPTTGMTRSFIAFFNGHLMESLYWNPFTFPVIGVMIWSIYSISFQCYKGKKLSKLSLSPLLINLWAVFLILAFIAKLIMGPETW